MANQPTLDELKKDRDTKAQAAIDAQTNSNEAHAAHAAADAAVRSATVATFDPKLVEEAHNWDVNPENFETNEQLQAAVDTASKTRQQSPQPEVATLNAELVTEAKELGLNPDEYTSDDALQNAIFKAQQAKQAKPGAMSEADAA